MIRTVLGDIPGESLGHTQCHEHLFIAKGRSFEVNPALYMDSEALALQELSEYARAGGSAIVDAQPVFCGRMARALQRASKASGVHIIAVTGTHKLLFYPEDAPVYSYSETALYELFLSEVQQGMLDAGELTDVRAGLVKTALDSCGVCGSKVYEKLHRAAAAAARDAGTALMLHTEPGADVLAAIDWFQKQGLAPDRLILCHMERTHNDLPYHRTVLQSGAYMCYDSINRLKYLPLEQELAFFTQAVALGCEKQILMGLDTTRERLRAYGAECGLDYIRRNFLTALRQKGISEEAIACFTQYDPAEALSLRP